MPHASIDPQGWTGKPSRVPWEVVDLFAALGLGGLAFTTLWLIARLGADPAPLRSWALVVVIAGAAGFLARAIWRRVRAR